MKINNQLISLLLCLNTLALAGQAPIHNILHMSFHKGCIEEFAAVSEELGLNVTSWFIQSDVPRFDGSTKGNAIYNITHERAEKVGIFIKNILTNSMQ